MDTQGRHLLVEFRGCPGARLGDAACVEGLMLRAARAAETTLVQSVFHAFAPQGVTGVVVVTESHLSIHTWPEHGYAAVDLYTCGNSPLERAIELLFEGLAAESVEVLEVERGHRERAHALRAGAHRLLTRA